MHEPDVALNRSMRGQKCLSVITFLSDSVSDGVRLSEGPSPPAAAVRIVIIRLLRQYGDDADNESSALSAGRQADIDGSLPGIACEAFTECDCGVAWR